MKLDKKTLRRGRHKVKKLFLLFIPLIIITIVLLAIFTTSLIMSLNKPLYVSPLSTLGIQAIRSVDDPNPQILAELLKQKNIEFTKISKLPDGSYKISLENNADVYVTFKKQINEQIASLQYILTRLTMEGKQFTQLDLRYDKPVIVIKQN